MCSWRHPFFREGFAIKASAFDYVLVASLAEALGLLAQHGDAAKILAGGQSLLPALNLRLSAPGVLIDIGGVGELRGISCDGEVLRIGALTTHAELLRSNVILQHAPLIARAVAHVAHPAIRTRGTIGGSLAHADPAAELPACVLALDGALIVQGPRGERVIPAEAFFTGLFATALAADEILTAIEILLRADAVWGFEELARRSGDYAIVGLAGVRAAGVVRLAYFSVGEKAVLARHAASLLAAGIEAAVAALPRDLAPHGDLQASAATRLHLAGVLLRRVAGAWA